MPDVRNISTEELLRMRDSLRDQTASDSTGLENVSTEQLLDMQERAKIQPDLTSMRFEPPSQPAVTTYAPPDPGYEVRGSLQPEIQERELGWGETAKAMGLGLVGGAIDVDPKGGSVLSRAVREYHGEPAYQVGEVLGYVVPYMGAAKAVSGVAKAPKLAKMGAKLPGLVRAGIRGAATGATAAGFRETGRAVQDREADISQVGKEALLFGAADVALRGGGRVLKKLIKPKPKPVAAPGKAIYRAGESKGKWWSESEAYVREGFGSRPIQKRQIPTGLRILDTTKGKTNPLYDLMTPKELKILRGQDHSLKTKVYDNVLKRNKYDGFKMLDEGVRGETSTTYYLRKPEVLVEAAKLKKPKPAVEAVEPVSEAAKKLVVNKTYAPTPKGMKPYKILRYPEVKRGELDVMMKIPEQSPKRLIGKVAEAVENPIRMHEKLGTKELMYHETRAVENNATRRIKKAAEEFKGVTKTLPFGSRSKSSERMMTYAIAQQRGGIKILGEMGITDIPKLTTKELTVYKYMRSELESLYKELQQARMAAGLKPFPKVDNYFTFFRTIEGELQAGRDIIHIDPGKVLRNKLRTEKTPFRFAKKRMLDAYGPVELDAIGVFDRYSQSALRHIEMTPQVAKLRQLLDGEFVNGFKLEFENPEAYRQLNDWTNFVSGVDVHNLPKVVERGLRKINRNLAYAVLSYNLRSAAIQPTAILNAITEVGPKYIQKGVQGLFNRQTRRLIMEKSNTLLGRKHDIAIADMMQGITGKYGGVKRKLGQAGLYPLQALDIETAKVTWWGAYLKGKQVFKYAEREAINYADDVVVRTQASAARSDLAPIQRSALGKSVATFQTFVINNWGFLTRDVVGIGNPSIKNRQAVKKVLTYIAGATVINSLFEDVLGTRSPFPAPIGQYLKRLKEGDSEAKALWRASLEMVELVPIIGGGVRYGSHPAGAFIQMVGDVGSTVTKPRISAKTAETAGKVLGVPGATQMKKAHRSWKEVVGVVGGKLFLF